MRQAPEMKIGQKFLYNAKHVGDEDAICLQLFHHQEKGWAAAFLSIGQGEARIFLGDGAGRGKSKIVRGSAGLGGVK